jgi:hypothetical protein
MSRSHLIVPAALAAGALLVGCGSSSKPQPAAGTQGQAPGALSAEAQSAAAGDIPDNQVFLTFRNTSAGYAMKYPEGWSQRGSAGDVTLQDKSNVVHVVVGSGPSPTVAGVRADLARLRAASPSLRFQAPRAMSLPGGPAVKATYTTESAPNPVTGKRVTLVVDRYVLARGGKRAVIDLGTPRGVDNVDAYRMMIESFRWR